MRDTEHRHYTSTCVVLIHTNKSINTHVPGTITAVNLNVSFPIPKIQPPTCSQPFP